jgi:dsDNA-specific endonuclease/ATPase MutS2
MEIQGIIYKIGQVQQVTDSFKKLELIVKTETQSQYPQHIKIQLSQDKCALADNLKQGDECKFSINLRGKLYTDRNGNENVITNLECWKVEVLTAAPEPAPAFDPFAATSGQAPATTPLPPAEADDLPF